MRTEEGAGEARRTLAESEGGRKAGEEGDSSGEREGGQWECGGGRGVQLAMEGAVRGERTTTNHRWITRPTTCDYNAGLSIIFQPKSIATTVHKLTLSRP